MKTRPSQTGFSLVELMVAMTLGLLLIAAVGALFLAVKRGHEQNSIVADMRLNARFALQTLSRDLAMAGFLGRLTSETALSGVTVVCDSANAASDALVFFNDTTSTPECLSNAQVAAGTDILIVHRTAGKPTLLYKKQADGSYKRDSNGNYIINSSVQSTLLSSDNFYVRTISTTGFLCVATTDSDSTHQHECLDDLDSGKHKPPWSFWQYQTLAYFIQDKTSTPPRLCRRSLSGYSGGQPTWQTVCVAAGVQNMQIAFGIDTDSDGIVDRYKTDPGASELADAVLARVQLLMRSPRPDPMYTNNNCYILQAPAANSTQFCADDHFYRRVVTMTMRLRNMD